jgi:hypothetical protein
MLSRRQWLARAPARIHLAEHASILIQPAWNGFAQLPLMHVSQRGRMGK